MIVCLAFLVGASEGLNPVGKIENQKYDGVLGG